MIKERKKEERKDLIKEEFKIRNNCLILSENLGRLVV
jgi:hypothetical protein